MFKRENQVKDISKSNDNANQSNPFLTNPISSKSFFSDFENINQRIEKLIQLGDQEIKSKGISQLVDSISSLSTQETLLLMSSNNEIVRTIAARAYVDKAPVNLIYNLKYMLKHADDYSRDAAVSAMCYMNSPELLPLLDRIASENSANIKMKALTGIADIATEYSSQEAREILQKYTDDEDPRIKEFVNDELSIIS